MKLDKITNWNKALQKRHYFDACGVAHALDLIGERWALLVMRELFWGPKRFGDIRAGLHGISANVLTQRLEGLEAAGLVIRRKLPPPASLQVYALTEWGKEIEPIFQMMGRWAARSPTHDPTLPFSASSLLLSLRTLFAPSRTDWTRASVGFRLGPETFVARISRAGIEIAHGDPQGTDVIFTGAPSALAGAIYGGVPLAVLEADGTIRIEGDRALAEKFVTLFLLPEKAPG